MLSRQMKYLSAAFAAVALIAMAAGARTIHPQTTPDAQPPAEHTQAKSPNRATTGSGAVDAVSRQFTPLRLHGILGCNAATPGLDCGKVERLLPE
jgi:hypothetical protein